MSGFVLMHRDIIDNPQFRGKDDIYAAMWLIMDAAWEPCTKRVGRYTVELERGQIAHAIEFFATAWECSKSTAHGRLKRFADAGFIDLDSRAGYTLVALRNYDKYQSGWDNPTRTQLRAKTERSSERSSERSYDEKNTGNSGGSEDHRQDGRTLVRTLVRTLPERSPNGLKEKKEIKEVNDDGYAGAPASVREAAAQEVVTHFLSERKRLWPGSACHPLPLTALLGQASGYIDQGASVAMVLTIITGTAEKMLGNGMRHPPTSLLFCHRTLSSRLASTTSGEKNHDQKPASRGAASGDFDDEQRRAALAAARSEIMAVQ